jgi:hypothetical protein
VATARFVILVVTYLLIAAQRVPFVRLNRPSAALIGAVAMVTIGRLPLHDAYAAIDLDVMVFLLGVLLVTAFLEIGGFFEWAARLVVRRATSARSLLGAVVVVSGLLSAFFVNDTICLVLTPLVLAVLRPLELRPLPFLLAIALGSNVGSASSCRSLCRRLAGWRSCSACCRSCTAASSPSRCRRTRASRARRSTVRSLRADCWCSSERWLDGCWGGRCLWSQSPPRL